MKIITRMMLVLTLLLGGLAGCNTQGGIGPIDPNRVYISETDGVSIGDHFAGGIVFYVDQSGAHGLVAAEMDLPGTYDWDAALRACLQYEVNGYSDWYLPSRSELNELYEHQDVVGGFGVLHYWSSSEYTANSAWYQGFSSGGQNGNG